MRTLARKLFVLAILGSSILSVGGIQTAAAEGTSESYQLLDESYFGGAVAY